MKRLGILASFLIAFIITGSTLLTITQKTQVAYRHLKQADAKQVTGSDASQHKYTSQVREQFPENREEPDQ